MPNNDYEPDLFTLEDEDGKEQTFELLDTYKEDSITYYAMIPRLSDPENLEEDDYFVILRKDEDDPDEYLNTIDDEDELDRIAGIFLERIAEAEDGFDEEEIEE